MPAVRRMAGWVGLDTSGRRRDTDRRGRARRLSDRGARRLHIRLYEDQRGHMAGIGTCSCSIDVIASILPYDRYIAAETFLSLSQVPGRFGTMFQSPEDHSNVFGCGRSEAGIDSGAASGFNDVSSTGILTYLRKLGGAQVVTVIFPLRLVAL